MISIECLPVVYAGYLQVIDRSRLPGSGLLVGQGGRILFFRSAAGATLASLGGYRAIVSSVGPLRSL